MNSWVHRTKLAGSGTAVAVLVLGLTAATVHADTIYVCWDGSGDYLTIQEGIDAAQDGDEVVVCDGTYTGPGNRDLDFGGKLITVRSENGPETCIIDCQGYGRGFYFYNGETTAAVVQGLTIRNGFAYEDGGGAVYCYQSSPMLTDCTFTGNSALGGWGFGGAVLCYLHANPVLTDCTITGNAAIWGGGVFCKYANPTLIDCTITDNTAEDDGGGVYCWENSSVKLTNCTITGNTAEVWGGGVACAGSNPTLTNCTMTSNTAGIRAGGGGVFCEEESSPTLTNCILWNDSPDEIYVLSGSPVVTYCDIQDGWAGDGNIDQDPLFVDPDNHDYHLSSNSPCINAGSNYAPELLDQDIEGNPRIQHCRVDMGAYESPYPPVTFEDCNENDVDDDCDIYEGTSADCNQNHVPDECDLADGTSDDYDLNGVPDECDPDCNENGVPDACDIDCDTGNCASHPLGCGGSDDYDLNGVPDECDPDCNANGIPDACDLDCATGNCASHPLGCGGSEDCNENDIPDECDIADGTSADCQRNGVPDECDIADGTSEDNNGNGVPDECEFECQANELAKLLPADGASRDNFGGCVAVSGDTAVIGARGDDPVGSAYVFRYDGAIWTEEARLAPSGGGNRFGCAVAVSGNVAAIRAYDLTYMFRFDGSTWVEEAELITPGGGHGYDKSVGISDDTAVVGAEGSKVAYVFRWDGSTWAEEATLVPSDGAFAFGFSVAVCEDTAVIGANLDGSACEGSAYVFRYDGSDWVQEAKLLASDGAADDFFGGSVAVSGDTAVIGAYGNDDQGSYSGSAYVFRYDGSNWVEEGKLVPSDGVAYDYFGNSVSVSGNTAVIGAPWADGPGSAYVFRYDGWSWREEAKLMASDGAPGDRLGYYSAAVSGNIAVIGAQCHDDNGEDSGSAYVFHGLSDCQPNGTIDICDITDGTSEDTNGNGIPDECECPGDIDGDGDTDHSDLGELLAAWCTHEGDPNWNPNADLDGDGHVGHGDLNDRA